MKKNLTQKSNTEQITVQKLSATRGRAMLQWYEKSAPKSIEWFPAQEKEMYGNMDAKEWNKLFWGDNKQVLSHLLKDYRGKIDLIYIDPPFDSKADYVKKIKLKGQQVAGVEQNAIEQMQYTDMWEKDEYLQFMYERIIIMRELLSDKGSLYLHCDYHKNAQLRLILDEVFGSDNFIGEFIWLYSGREMNTRQWNPKHDTIFCYGKTDKWTFNWETVSEEPSKEVMAQYKNTDENGRKFVIRSGQSKGLSVETEDTYRQYYKTIPPRDYKYFPYISSSDQHLGYPTQKPEHLIEHFIKASSNEGDLVMDCFIGSGTTLAVAQKLNRRWIGCDINKGAIITTTERLSKIINTQKGENLFGKNSKGLDAFKVYNVNHYEVFTNDIQARQLLIETYRIDELTRGDFDGTLGTDYVKIISPNRVLSKMDITQVIDAIKKNKDLFTIKTVSKQKETTFENKVIVICSGAELDVRDFVRKENNTGVEIEVRDIQIDKKELDFKKPTEAFIEYAVKGNKLTVMVKDYYSPLLMKRLELENEKRLSVAERVNLFDFRQAIEHIVIDVNYGEGQKKNADIAFNADIFLHKEKKSELVDTTHEYSYDKKGTYVVAVKIVDVLGEEYFETHEITIK